MKGICFQSVGVVEYVTLEDPKVESPSDVIVQVEMAGMCGSDLHPFFGREVGLDPQTVMGHELVGTIVAKGPEVKQFNVGDRVYTPFSTSCGICYYCTRGLTSRCAQGEFFGWRSQGIGLHGGQAELVRVPLADSTLVSVPTGLSAESALLLGDNLSTGYFCADMANIDPDGVTVVIGCGTVGLLATMAAQWLGAKQIVAVDPVESRLDFARSLGVFTTAPGNSAIDRVRSLSSGRGADSVLELVGLPDAQKLAYEILRPGGTMSVIGCHSAPTFSFTPTDAYNKNITYKTGRCPARHYMDILTPRLLEMKWDVDRLVTHRFEPNDCRRAYETFANQKEGCIKAVFEFAPRMC